MYSENNLPKVLAPQHKIRTWVLLIESPKLYPRATALYNCYLVVVVVVVIIVVVVVVLVVEVIASVTVIIDNNTIHLIRKEYITVHAWCNNMSYVATHFLNSTHNV